MFDFIITYRSGKVHRDADGFSRMPHTTGLGAEPAPDEDYIKPFLDRLSSSTEETLHVCQSDTFQAICQYHEVLQPFDASEVPVTVVKAISMSSQSVESTLLHGWGSSSPICLPSIQWKDPTIGQVLELKPDNPEHLDVERKMSLGVTRWYTV